MKNTLHYLKILGLIIYLSSINNFSQAKVSSTSVAVGVSSNVAGQQYYDQIYPCNLEVAQMPVNTKLKAESIYGSMVQVPLGANGDFGNQGSQKSFGLSSSDTVLFSTSEQWLTQINQLILNLSTENLGVGYNIHVCYLGPIKTLSQTTDVTEKIYTQSNAIFISTMNAAQIKSNASNPMIYRMTTQCDLRNVGSQVNPRTATEITPVANGLSLEADFVYSTNWVTLDEKTTASNLEINTNQVKQVPRFCEFIYEIRETKTTPRSQVEAPLDLNINLDLY